MRGENSNLMQLYLWKTYETRWEEYYKIFVTAVATVEGTECMSRYITYNNRGSRFVLRCNILVSLSIYSGK